jgi:hypothetical protein
LEHVFDGCWGAFVVTNFYDAVHLSSSFPQFLPCPSLRLLTTTPQKITDDPTSEEQQGRNAAIAAKKARVKCYIFSTLPSSLEISGGRVNCEIYEGKHRVDRFIRDELRFGYGDGKDEDEDEDKAGALFVYTGNFYENMILRGHVVLIDDGGKGKRIEFRQPIIQGDSRCEAPWRCLWRK